ncbi:MAG: hypothetical protein JWP41_3611 [Ramlibacter sp.]|nr:hypothetical protein [Ramlibacter sp.]
MTAASTDRLLLSAPAGALPGTWKLARGRAITLRPAMDGVLRVAHGRVWATTDGPHGRTPTDAGDHVLEVGRSMVIKAGQRVVIEAWNANGASYFAWDVLPAAAFVMRPRPTPALVLQPLADLRTAIGLGGRALGQLARGLAGLAWDRVRGGRRLPGRRPHGAAV